MPRTARLATALALTALPAVAQDLTPVSFGTNWVAQAEHGGFYQAVADGTYEACGLDVTIVPGGPQVNNRALMLAGRIDFSMGGDLLGAFDARNSDIPVTVVAAIFQKHPQVILAHPQVTTWEGLKDLTLLIGDNGFTTFYQWMIAAYGFTVEQREPYTFNPAPFLADDQMGMQGYLSSEPYLVEQEGGFEPSVFLIADHGYATYATTIEAMQQTIDERPDVVGCFVDSSILGWATYLYGDDSSAADQLILEANPDMSQDKIDFAKEQMRDYEILTAVDAQEGGIGAMSDATIEAFFDDMVEAGVLEPDVPWQDSYTLDFVNKNIGSDLLPE